MDDRANEISEALANAIYGLTRNHVQVEGIVTSVNLVKYTCTVRVGKSGTDPGSTFFSVPLKVLIGIRASVIEIPAINSNCHLGFLDGDLQRPQLIRVDQTNDFLINVGGKVIFNEGQLGGMVKVIELTERLNLVENAVNKMVQTYNLHTHPVIAEGTPTGVPNQTDTDNLDPTTREMIENDKILQ